MMKNISLFAVTSVALSSVMSAATISYDAPISIPDDSGSVFQNTGTQVFGMNLGNGGSGTTTINGVDFVAGGRSGNVQSLTQSGMTVTMTVDGGIGDGQITGQASGFYTNTVPATDIFDLVNVGYTSSAGTGSIALDFSGLSIGQEYRVQTFHFMKTGGETSREMYYTGGDGSDSAAFHQYYTGGTDVGDLSNAVTMTFTFTADASTLSLDLLPVDEAAGIDRAYLSGISVYSIPEPSSAAMLLGALSLAVVITSRRRR